MKNKILAFLKENEEYISGENIGEALGVSRSAVWKGIKNLREEGYEIEAVSNKGYKLIESHDMLNEADVYSKLKTQTIGKKIHILETIDSTNNYLKKIAYNGGLEGEVVISHEQTTGKGRRGKSWVSKKGEGLWMSVLLRPEIHPSKVSVITLVTGLSVCQGLKKLGYDASIKWPNDIIINNKKVCGILAEMGAEMERVDYIISGIGVNVNTKEFSEDVKDVAISLYQVNKVEEKRYNVAAAILNELEKYYNILKENGFKAIKEEYEENSITIGSHVKVIGVEEFEGEAIGINHEGELIVKRENGIVETVYSGEVSIRGVL